MLPADETQALASRARIVARAVVGLVLDEQRAARFVQAYSSEYGRLGIAGEAEHKAEFLGAIERESLLLVAARIERTLPQVIGSRFSRQAQSEAVAGFREAFLTFLGGSLAWDYTEREAFHRDLSIYLRLAEREGRVLGPRRRQAPAAGAFVDRCAFLVDPSMMAQAREAASHYQAELVSCADQAVRAAFRGLRARPVPSPSFPGISRFRAERPISRSRRKPLQKAAKPKPEEKRPTAPRAKPAQRRKPTPRLKAVPRRKPAPRRKAAARRKAAPRREVSSRQTRKVRPKSMPRAKSTRRKKLGPRHKPARHAQRPSPKRPKK